MGLSSSESSDESANSAWTPLADRAVEMAAAGAVPPNSMLAPIMNRARLPEFLCKLAETKNDEKKDKM